MKTRTCKICEKVYPFENIWMYDEVGKGNWSETDKKWFIKNEPICDDCIKAYFKKYFDEWGHLKEE